MSNNPNTMTGERWTQDGEIRPRWCSVAGMEYEALALLFGVDRMSVKAWCELEPPTYVLHACVHDHGKLFNVQSRVPVKLCEHSLFNLLDAEEEHLLQHLMREVKL